MKKYNLFKCFELYNSKNTIYILENIDITVKILSERKIEYNLELQDL
jgi:hypothetical protein